MSHFLLRYDQLPSGFSLAIEIFLSIDTALDFNMLSGTDVEDIMHGLPALGKIIM